MIKNSLLEIFIGDLNSAESDAVVIPTNSKLLPSGELRIKILRKAGSRVQIECNTIINKILQVAVGESVMTTGGECSQYLIHANTSRLGQVKEGQKLMQAIWNSLKLADAKNLNSIVFPPISKEMRGFTTEFCAKAMLLSIKKYLSENNANLKKVSICVEFKKDLDIFEGLLTEIAPKA